MPRPSTKSDKTPTAPKRPLGERAKPGRKSAAVIELEKQLSAAKSDADHWQNRATKLMSERNAERDKNKTLKENEKTNELAISILTFAGVTILGIALVAIAWGLIGWNR